MDAATNNQNPKTARLIRLTGSQATIRLSAADRGFLRDLARLQLISSDLADRHRYGHLKGASVRSRSHLRAAGLITGKLLNRTGSFPLRTYPFARCAIAKAYGGRLPATGAKQTELHELMTTRAHYARRYSLQTADFRLAGTHEHCQLSRPRCLAGNRITHRGLTLSALQHRILARLANAQFATGSRRGFRHYAQRARCQRGTAASALRARSGPDLGFRLVRAQGHRAQAPGGARMTRQHLFRSGSVGLED